MSEIKWYKESNKEQTVRMAALQFNILNPTRYTHAELVDEVNRRLAKKKGTVVPEEVVLIKKPSKPAQPTTLKTNKEITPKAVRKPVERKPKEATPIQEVPSGTIILITGRPMKDGKVILANRKMLLTGIKGELLLGQLLHERTNEPQKSVISMPIQFTDYKLEREVAIAQ